VLKRISLSSSENDEIPSRFAPNGLVLFRTNKTLCLVGSSACPAPEKLKAIFLLRAKAVDHKLTQT
jgi:hypothetical protein